MAKTIRQLIVEEVKTRMQTIVKSNGYVTDAGEKVYVWREYPTKDKDSPCVVVRDTAESIEAVDDFEHNHTLTIEIGIKGQTDIEIREIIGDVYTACGTDLSWGGYAYSTEPESADIEIELSGQTIADTSFRISIMYMTERWNPYNRIM